MEASGIIAVCGATGRQGGAVARALLRRGRPVRALTRSPQGRAARALAAAGAEVLAADMGDEASLRRAFAGAGGVFSVQNGIASGFDAEVEQGRAVARAARAAGVGHLVYGSAARGREPTGVRSWDVKPLIEQEIRDCALPFTILRPSAFMELMTDRSFHPALGTWRIWPSLTGWDRPIPWLALRDLGEVAAEAFSDPARYAGRELTLTGDVRTLRECRTAYREVLGRDPRSLPMPAWLFDRFTRGDPAAMWRHLRDGEVDADPAVTREILPSALRVREWLESVRVEGRTR